VGAHHSVAPALEVPKDSPNRSSVPRTLLDPGWVSSLAETFVAKSICANVWCIVNFDSNEVGLDSLYSLAGPTGGAVHRSVLGLHPAQERVRLSEALRRAVTALQATRCVLKLRTLNLLKLLPETLSGGAVPDSELPGVLRIAACTPDKTLGMSFIYDVALKNDTKRYAEMVVQVAFSYETLAETEELLEPPVPASTAAAGATGDAADGLEGSGDDASLYTDSSDEGGFTPGTETGSNRSSRQKHARRVRANPLPGRRRHSDANKEAVGAPAKNPCKMRTTENGGFYEESVAQLGLAPVHEQVRKHYHVADAKLAARRQALQYSKFIGVQDGFMLPQDVNREGDLSTDHKLLVVRYLRIYTAKVVCSAQVLHLLACSDAATHITLQMRHALQLERQHRLYRLYTPENTKNYGDSSHRTTQNGIASADYDGTAHLKTFTDKINMQSPGVTLLVNTLIERIITIVREYAREKQERSRPASPPRSRPASRGNTPRTPMPSPGPPVSLSLSSPADVDALLVEVMAYPIVRDMLIYTFAAVDKLNLYTPTVGVDNRAYLSDDGAYFENNMCTLDAVNVARVLHPLLLPVSDDLRLAEEFLPLTRRSVVTSAQQYLYLDAGTECMLYRSTNAPTSGSHTAPTSTAPGQKEGGGRFPHMLELAPLDTKTLEICANGVATARRETGSAARRSSSQLAQLGEPALKTSASADKLPGEEVRAPRLVNSMYDALFLPNYLQRRLRNLDLVPRVHVCESGSASASAFAAHLLEDHSNSGLVFAQFLKFVTEVVKRDIVEA
jgi:hypothetical protein